MRYNIHGCCCHHHLQYVSSFPSAKGQHWTRPVTTKLYALNATQELKTPPSPLVQTQVHWPRICRDSAWESILSNKHTKRLAFGSHLTRCPQQALRHQTFLESVPPTPALGPTLNVTLWRSTPRPVSYSRLCQRLCRLCWMPSLPPCFII